MSGGQRAPKISPQPRLHAQPGDNKQGRQKRQAEFTVHAVPREGKSLEDTYHEVIPAQSMQHAEILFRERHPNSDEHFAAIVATRNASRKPHKDAFGQGSGTLPLAGEVIAPEPGAPVFHGTAAGAAAQETSRLAGEPQGVPTGVEPSEPRKYRDPSSEGPKVRRPRGKRGKK